MSKTITAFDKAQQRLPTNKRDINQYKSLDDVKATISQIDNVSKTQRKQTAKAKGSKYIGTVSGYDVYFITSHQACMLLGKGTKWCITQNDGVHWDNYVKKVKFFYAIKQTSDHNSYDKIAFACYLSGGAIEVFDAQDNSIGTRADLELRDFIEVAKNKYINYTVTSQNQTITFVNDKIEGPVKKDDRIEWYKDGELHREDGPAIETENGAKYWYQWGKLHREDGPAVELISGANTWYLNGVRHREGGPAMIEPDGSQMWFHRGKLHREDGPAVERSNGDKEWYVNGKLHREDGPAREWAEGDKEWYKNDKLHRENGPAIELINGRKEWYQNGRRHREGGPAVEYPDGHKEWWYHGHRHRKDGPAIEYKSGIKYWYIYGEEYSQKEFEKLMNK
jgi:hypothetical protein